MPQPAQAEKAYAYRDSQQETNRPIKAAQVADQSLRRLFEDAGLTDGMRVLDVGSGAGDVAMAAADRVGPTGSVVGIELDMGRVETARQRARAAGLANVTFHVADLTKPLDFDAPFDALVGRNILQHLVDPLATLRGLICHVRPGGLVVFQEPDVLLWYAYPPFPLAEQARQWVSQVLAKAGGDNTLGRKLYHLFLDAGLEPPALRVHGLPFGPYSAWPGTQTQILRGLLPAMIASDVAAAAEVDIDTFEGRYRAEMAEQRSIVMFSGMVDAWARKPAAVHEGGTG